MSTGDLKVYVQLILEAWATLVLCSWENISLPHVVSIPTKVLQAWFSYAFDIL